MGDRDAGGVMIRIGGWAGPVLPLLMGLLLAAASLTPSLIPRGTVAQGVLAGASMALGYLVTQFVLALWRSLEIPVLRGAGARAAHLVVAVPVLGLLLFCLLRARSWQNDIRHRMGLSELEVVNTLRMAMIALAVFLALYVIGLLIQGLFNLLRRRLARHIPTRSADVLGLLLSALVILIVTRDGVVGALMRFADPSYAAAQHLTHPEAAEPVEPWRPGSAESLVSWDLMGKPGRDFVRGGPDARAIQTFNGRPAKQPLRIYVGLAQDSDPQVRARIAFDEMQRVGAFERRILVVSSPTGTGWMDPASYDALEYMHDGDVATVAVQYSYLQSPLALIFEADSGLDQAAALVQLVYEHWAAMPRDQRPQLYMHGISLGSWSSMYAFNVFQMMNEPINGALWVGPPFPSTLWNQANAARQPDSPFVLPVVDDGQVIRYASQYAKPLRLHHGWGRMRVLFLQYASDPIVFYSASSAWREPVWMREPKAPDVSPLLSFTPIVTQLQLTVDLALSTSTPPGYGHVYHVHDYIDAWSAVTRPDHWDGAAATRLKAHCGQGGLLGCANGS
ncbi:alpha/beta-hydrolase family protein [Paracoccus sp. DMF-8]|uniref:alpha/beta hydrolase n=1 Tax=Paracoccus sp. DMF-8 TaxID=3019445 RepID=UPI0023E7D6DD|nr:alpha/beta-hydrolase family protein [Paracoccus sp. DMF-8]MDF3607044.1 alpha/beta-hydrolase family protein [Paracoccus sp. DMF-8]